MKENLIPLEERNEQQKNIEKSLLILASDASIAEDSNVRILSLCEDVNDPTFVLMVAMACDPEEGLRYIYDQGARVGEEVHGLAMVMPAVRHLGFFELAKVEPDAGERYRAVMRREGVAGPVDPISDEEVAQYYANEVMPNLPHPCQMSEDKHIHSHIGVALLRDGTAISVEKTSSQGEWETFVYRPEGLKPGVGSLLYTTLCGMRPDSSCEDPIQAVRDNHILQALDF